MKNVLLLLTLFVTPVLADVHVSQEEQERFFRELNERCLAAANFYEYEDPVSSCLCVTNTFRNNMTEQDIFDGLFLLENNDAPLTDNLLRIGKKAMRCTQ